MNESIDILQIKLNYIFKDRRLCEEALTTAGIEFQVTAGHTHFDGNASLAQIGDAILRISVGRRSRELHESKGQTSIRMQRVTNNTTLAEIFDEAELSPHVIINPSQQGVISSKTKATVLEALLGAVHEDANQEAALAVVQHLGIE